MNILVAKNGTQLGPFSEDDVRSRLSSGEFLPNDLGWCEGLPSWVPLVQLVPPAEPPPPMPMPSSSLAPSPSPYAPTPAPSYYAPNPAPYPQTMMPGWGAPGAVDFYAGFWLRFVASIIDLVVVTIIGFFAGILVGILAAVLHVGHNGFNALANLASFVITYGYFAGMVSTAGQATFGKMAMGIKVTDENGNRIGFGRSLGRELGKLLSGFILCVGFLMAAFTQRKQALHDLMAGCLVVRK